MDNSDILVIIEEFPDYAVTNRGEVINLMTNRVMTLSPTMNDDLTVGFWKDGRQHRRSVKVLVARAFVMGETDIYDTPIQLDGNKHNLHAENIVWRPRWFAWQYTRQHSDPHLDQYDYGMILDITSNTRYHSILEASMVNGLLCKDIEQSIRTGSYVFPTGQIFANF